MARPAGCKDLEPRTKKTKSEAQLYRQEERRNEDLSTNKEYWMIIDNKWVEVNEKGTKIQPALSIRPHQN